jgi:hypothetical protein
VDAGSFLASSLDDGRLSQNASKYHDACFPALAWLYSTETDPERHPIIDKAVARPDV